MALPIIFYEASLPLK